MTMRVMPGRADRATAATGDTGPLIPALQSDSFPLLARLFSAIYIPPTCQRELQNHGWATYPGAGAPTLHVLRLSSDEDSEAMRVAAEIAAHPRTSNRDPSRHLGEAEAIVLAGRAAIGMMSFCSMSGSRETWRRGQACAHGFPRGARPRR